MNEVGISLDTVWMLLAAMLVFWMQPGFGCKYPDEELCGLHVRFTFILLYWLRLYVWCRYAGWFYWYA